MPYRGYNKLKVLIVDDFDGFRSTLTGMLESFGVLHVDSVRNSQEAMVLCKERQYGVIFSDYNLGTGRTGLQFLEELRYRRIIRRHQIFILISAENSKQIVLAATDVEPDAYLSKPITAKALLTRLDRLLKQRQQLKPLFDALDANNNPAAIQVCQEHIRNRSHHAALCQKTLGQLLIDEEKYPEAEQVYKSVLEVRPLEWAKIGMANVKLQAGEFTTAERWYREIIATNPLCLKAYDGLARVYECLQDDENLQQVLQQAVEVSPLALLRQETLAETAVKNCDFATAAKSYRRVVRLADNSVYKTPEQNLSFARTTIRLQEQDKSMAYELSRDAIKKVALIEEVEEEPDILLQGKLLQTQLFVLQQNTNSAHECYSQANEQINRGLTDLSFDTELELIKTQKSMGDLATAENRLNQLLSVCEQEEDKLEQLDALLPEPRSNKNRKLVARINKEGIRHYQAKNYVQAIDSFTYAKRLFPNHIGVRLNLVQVIVEEMSEFGGKEEFVNLAEECLAHVGEAIEPGDGQYHRYVQLQEMLKNLVRQQ